MKALPISNLQLSQNSIEQEYLNYKEDLIPLIHTLIL